MKIAKLHVRTLHFTRRLIVPAFACLSVYIKVNAADIAPFAASGVVITESFASGTTNTIFKLEARVLFFYSNGWWQVESTYLNGIIPNLPAKTLLSGTVLNCSSVDGGTRLFATFATNEAATSRSAEALTAATVQPIRFPPPEQLVLFLPWLSLCPNPALPAIDSTIIRRFLNTSLLHNIKNQGTYTAKYISPVNVFLSELDITNNGIQLHPDGRATRYSEPFDNGYKEADYRVLETTNYNGILFPAKTTLNYFSPLHNAKSLNDVYISTSTRFVIQLISGDKTFRAAVPSKLIALDSRPSGFKSGVTMNYIVTNDQWPSLTNPQMKYLQNVFRQQDSLITTEPMRAKANVVLCIIISLSVLPLVIVLVKTRKNERK